MSKLIFIQELTFEKDFLTIENKVITKTKKQNENIFNSEILKLKK